MSTVFLFDVDNTLLDNDGFIADLGDFIRKECDQEIERRYWEVYEERRDSNGYADYLGTLQACRDERPRDQRLLGVSSYILNYQFPSRLYPGSLDVLARLSAMGQTVILSDGDAVFQPHKVRESGLHDAVGGRVLIYIHKEKELDDVARRFPADRYVLIDDKPRLLTAVKEVWGARVTTVLPRQGHYATAAEVAKYPAADVTVERVGEVAAALRDVPGVAGQAPHP